MRKKRMMNEWDKQGQELSIRSFIVKILKYYHSVKVMNQSDFKQN